MHTDFESEYCYNYNLHNEYRLPYTGRYFLCSCLILSGQF